MEWQGPRGQAQDRKHGHLPPPPLQGTKWISDSNKGKRSLSNNLIDCLVRKPLECVEEWDLSLYWLWILDMHVAISFKKMENSLETITQNNYAQPEAPDLLVLLDPNTLSTLNNAMQCNPKGVFLFLLHLQICLVILHLECIQKNQTLTCTSHSSQDGQCQKESFQSNPWNVHPSRE